MAVKPSSGNLAPGHARLVQGPDFYEINVRLFVCMCQRGRRVDPRLAEIGWMDSVGGGKIVRKPVTKERNDSMKAILWVLCLSVVFSCGRWLCIIG